MKDLLSELELMKRLKRHPHVIKLLGYVTETGGWCWVFLFSVWQVLGVIATCKYALGFFRYYKLGCGRFVSIFNTLCKWNLSKKLLIKH